MKRTYTYKLKLTAAQEATLTGWLSTCRILYNSLLWDRIRAYEDRQETLTRFTQTAVLTQSRKLFPELRQVPVSVARSAIEQLDLAYKHFFRRCKDKSGKPGFPRFKREDRFNSLGWQCVTHAGFRGLKFFVPGIGLVSVFKDRSYQGSVRTIRIVRLPDGWFLRVALDGVPESPGEETGTAVGLDVGLHSFVALSTGELVEHPQILRQAEYDLRVAQRQCDLTRKRHGTAENKKKGSRRYGKARRQVSLFHQSLARTRRLFLRTLAHRLALRFDLICAEKLNIKGMVRNRHLSKSIADSGWGMFLALLAEESEDHNKNLILVDARNTSQACSGCGVIVAKDLSVRVHKCPDCGLEIDRDVNAALNVLHRGVKEFKAVGVATAGEPGGLQSAGCEPRTTAHKNGAGNGDGRAQPPIFPRPKPSRTRIPQAIATGVLEKG